uniref:Uncharacterized protein n=1 Tax=Rhizophora mucronata TaxID=61149 RepID=A0A2P2P1W8_RHIMU
MIVLPIEYTCVFLYITAASWTED